MLIACHSCDALLTEPPRGAERTRCPRCHSVLTTERRGAIDGVLASAVSTIVLLMAAIFLPFITIDVAGRHRDAAVADAIHAAGAEAWLLAIAVGAMIVALPLIRALSLLWVLTPIRLGYAPLRFAKEAFRLAIELRPWSMMEIFIIGAAVALVKIAGLALVGLGAAFWLFVALAAVTLYEDVSLCRRTVWRLLAR